MLSCEVRKHKSFHFSRKGGVWEPSLGSQGKENSAAPASTSLGTVALSLISVSPTLPNVSLLKHFLYCFTCSEVSHSTPSLAAARHLHTASTQSSPCSPLVSETPITARAFKSSQALQPHCCNYLLQQTPAACFSLLPLSTFSTPSTLQEGCWVPPQRDPMNAALTTPTNIFP